MFFQFSDGVAAVPVLATGIAIFVSAAAAASSFQVDAGTGMPSTARRRLMASPRSPGSSRVSTSPALGCDRSEEHTSELQSLMRISYAVFCLKQKNIILTIHAETSLETVRQH